MGWKEELGEGRVVEIPGDPLERIAVSLEKLARQNNPEELQTLNKTLLANLDELTSIMIGMGVRLERKLNEPSSALERAQLVRDIAAELQRYGKGCRERFANILPDPGEETDEQL